MNNPRTHMMVGLGLVVAILAAMPAAAVVRDVPGSYATIQAAIDAASDGDEVVVAAGSYARINFNGKAITVRSTDPTNLATVAATVISGGNSAGTVVRFSNGEGAGSIIDGLTVQAGRGASIGDLTCGGGIFCSGSSPTIRRCRIRSNLADYGGGIGALSAGPTIVNNIIFTNTATTGAGIYASSDPAPTIAGNLIYSNTANSVGGGVFLESSTGTLTNCTVNGNFAYNGGNICTSGAPWTIKNSIVTSATRGGGIECYSGDAPAVQYCNVYGNTAANYVGMTDPTGTAGNISVDPLYVDAPNADFRLQSEMGHWTAAGWVLDLFTSPCLDKGDPASAWVNEPAPNGSRINMGYDGNTAHASKSAIIPRIVGQSPRHVGGLNTAPFTASFSVPMFRASVENNFSISPAVAGAFSWSGRKLIFTPTTPWQPNKWYTAKINRVARSAQGVRMAAAFVWNFKTVAPTAPSLVSASATATAAGAQITLNLAAAADVQVRVLNVAGREVAVLPEQALPAGTRTLLWNGRSTAGTPAPAGRYLVKVAARQAGGEQSSVIVPLTR